MELCGLTMSVDDVGFSYSPPSYRRLPPPRKRQTAGWIVIAVVMVCTAAIVAVRFGGSIRASNREASGNAGDRSRSSNTDLARTLEDREPFVKQLKSLRNAHTIGMQQRDYNERVIKLADTLEELKPILARHKECESLLSNAESAVAEYTNAAREWTRLLSAEDEASRAVDIYLRNNALIYAEAAGDSFIAEHALLKKRTK